MTQNFENHDSELKTSLESSFKDLSSHVYMDEKLYLERETFRRQNFT